MVLRNCVGLRGHLQIDFGGQPHLVLFDQLRADQAQAAIDAKAQ